jgi:spermidine/putrescine-binding protein
VTGIGYLAELERAPDSWAALFDPAQAAYYDENGGINLLDDPRELIGATLQYLGYSGNDADPEHLNEARDVLINVLPSVEYINASDYMDTLLPSNEVAISHSWDGPVLQAARATASEDNPQGDWRFVLPKEGGFRWQDGLCIPSNSPSKDTAEHFINYLFSAEAGARIAGQTGYLTANTASRALIPEGEQGFVPSPEQVEKLEWFRPLSDEALQLYDQVWTEIRASQ